MACFFIRSPKQKTSSKATNPIIFKKFCLSTICVHSRHISLSFFTTYCSFILSTCFYSAFAFPRNKISPVVLSLHYSFFLPAEGNVPLEYCQPCKDHAQSGYGFATNNQQANARRGMLQLSNGSNRFITHPNAGAPKAHRDRSGKSGCSRRHPTLGGTIVSCRFLEHV